MQDVSTSDLERQLEAIEGESAVGDPTRMDRRHFLRSGTLTVAGLAALTGMELVRPAPARAQDGTPDLSTVNYLALTAKSAQTVPGSQTLRICRHAYQFDYKGGVAVPPDLVAT